MATQTFEQLIAGADKIKHNQLPESNTSGLVGEQLIKMINKQKEEKDERLKGIAEYNVSVQHPTGGVGSSEKYTFESAIQHVPNNLRRRAIKCAFTGTDGLNYTYEYQGGTYTDKANWLRVDGEEIHSQRKAVESAKEEALNKINQQKVTPDMLSQETKDLINASGGGTITNNADGTDLASAQVEGVNVIRFADRKHEPSKLNGLGRVYLRADIVQGKRVLTQEMVSAENTVYVIRDDFDLNGVTIKVPDKCTLKFDGGSIRNGSLSGSFTIHANKEDVIFYNIHIEHSLPYCYLGWFDVDNTGNEDASYALIDFIQSVRLRNSTLEFKPGIYLHGDGVTTGIQYHPLIQTGDKWRPDIAGGASQTTGRDIILKIIGYNNLIILGNYATIKSNDNNAEVYHNSILWIEDCKYIYISKINIDGRKNQRKPKLSDWSVSRIAYRGNISAHNIDGLYMTEVFSDNSMMDGLCLDNNIHNCIIQSCRFNNNYRQGITVGNKCDYIRILYTECSFQGKDYGTFPMAGIDLEANATADSKSTLIQGCVFNENKGSAIDMAVGAKFNVIDSCYIKRSGGVGGNTSSGESYNNIIKNCYIEDTPILLNIPGFSFTRNTCIYTDIYDKDNVLLSNLSKFDYSKVTDKSIINATVIVGNIFYNKNTKRGNACKIVIYGNPENKDDVLFFDNIVTNTNSNNSVNSIHVQDCKTVMFRNNTFYNEIENYATSKISNVDIFLESSNRFINFLSSLVPKFFPNSFYSGDKKPVYDQGTNVGQHFFDKKKCVLNIWNGKEWLDGNGRQIIPYNQSGINILKPEKSEGVYCRDIQSNGVVGFWNGFQWTDSFGFSAGIKKRGTSEERPVLKSAATDVGFQFYDTTLKKYICWNGAAWTNLDGTSL